MVVFDTNVLVSAALLAGSKPDRCLRKVLDESVPLFFSEATFLELADVLLREKFDRYVSRSSRQALLAVWQEHAFFVPATALQEPVMECRDVSDNKFLELALATEAKILVTGDPDLLVLDPWRGIRIVSIGDFEAVFAALGG